MFPSFIENPDDCNFEGQNPEEEVLLLLRAHPVTTLAWIIPAILVFFLPLIVLPTFKLFGFAEPQVPGIYTDTVLVINYLLVLIILFEGFLGWYFNVDIITTKRIFDINFTSILSKDVDLALLEDVQEANSKMAGLLNSIFNFGTVVIQTSGAQIEMHFDAVPNPDRVVDIIMDQKERVAGMKNSL